MFRSRHSPEYTARGVANGVFWGLTPTVGLQTFEILATWFIARKVFRADSSLLQAMIWVWVNNPVTMVPMYFAFYLTGLWLTGEAGLDYDSFASLLNGDGSWLERVATMAATVGIPTLIGCLPFAALGGALSYRWATAVVRRRRSRIHEPQGL